MEIPRFSILIPVYNRERYIKESIDSIFLQTYKNFEIIAIDDGSQDRTLEVMQSYGARIISLSQKNQGPEFARDLGASHAIGEYLVFLDSDDCLLPWALETYNRIVEQCSSPAIIIGMLYYYQDGQFSLPETGPYDVIDVVKYENYFTKDMPVGLSCSNIVIKRKIYLDGGGNRITWPPAYPADQHDTVLRFGTYGPCVILKRPKTVAYRIHDSNVIHDVDCVINKGILSLIHSERLGLYPGGKKYLCARFSIIGGLAFCWIKKALKFRKFFFAFKLFIIAGPMIFVGFISKIKRNFHHSSSSIIPDNVTD